MPPESDLHRTKFSSGDLPALKISGSAYKMIRGRSLHHGTCLVASPSLGFIGSILKSPARGFLKARGVDSVPSPVGNLVEFEPQTADVYERGRIRDHIEVIKTEIGLAFVDMYGLGRLHDRKWTPRSFIANLQNIDDLAVGIVDEEWMEIPEIAKGVEELQVCLEPGTGVYLLMFCLW